MNSPSRRLLFETVRFDFGRAVAEGREDLHAPVFRSRDREPESDFQISIGGMGAWSTGSFFRLKLYQIGEPGFLFFSGIFQLRLNSFPVFHNFISQDREVGDTVVQAF